METQGDDAPCRLLCGFAGAWRDAEPIAKSFSTLESLTPRGSRDPLQGKRSLPRCCSKPVGRSDQAAPADRGGKAVVVAIEVVLSSRLQRARPVHRHL